MKYTLTKANSLATINTNGGYVDSYEVSGNLIFFPKVMVKIGNELKVRGGMHVCAPNFGSDKILNALPNHGFCRDRNWEVTNVSDDKIALSLEGEGDYENCLFSLDYSLEEKSLLARLTVENKGNKEVPLAPAFHPYFYSDHSPIVINGVNIDQDKLPGSIIDSSKNQDFIANGNKIEVCGLENVNEFVFWTDFMGDYLCVEPTYRSIAFSDSIRKTYKLGENESFSLEIKILVKS